MATKEAVNGASKSEDMTNTQDIAVAPPPPSTTIRPNIVKPINILLDDTKPEDYYQLRMTNRAMQLIEDTLGISLWEGIGGITNIKAKHIAVMVWACLRWKFPDLTLEEVEELPGMDMGNYLYIVTTLDRVVYGNLPESEPVKEGETPDPNASPSAGSNSGQLES